MLHIVLRFVKVKKSAKKSKLCHRPNFRFGPMASLKTFYWGKGPYRPVSIGFVGRSVGWKVGPKSVGPLPCLQNISLAPIRRVSKRCGRELDPSGEHNSILQQLFILVLDVISKLMFTSFSSKVKRKPSDRWYNGGWVGFAKRGWKPHTLNYMHM